jgi:protein TonB
MSPYPNVIVGNSFEEIVFSNRNKEYGAYMLRKKQKGYLFIAFISAFLFVASSVVTPMIYNHIKGSSSGPLVDSLIVISEIDTSLRVELPEPPKINLDQNVARFIPPQVVEDADSTNDPFDVIDKILASNQIIDLPLLPGMPVEPDPLIDAEPTIHMVVEEPAKFNGGNLMEFNKWVAQNLNYPQLAIDNQIQGKVTVQFVINDKGKVESATILRGVDPSLDEEAKRVITSSPLWTPPKQGGRPVKQLFTLPVIFKLQDN